MSLKGNTEAELDIKAKEAILRIVDGVILRNMASWSRVSFLNRPERRDYYYKMILHRNRIANLFNFPKREFD